MSYDRTFLSSVRNCSKRKEFLAKGIFMIVETCGFKIRLNECRIFILNFLVSWPGFKWKYGIESIWFSSSKFLFLDCDFDKNLSGNLFLWLKRGFSCKRKEFPVTKKNNIYPWGKNFLWRLVATKFDLEVRDDQVKFPVSWPRFPAHNVCVD